MKLALVSPLYKSDNKSPPLTLAILASFVREKHPDLEIAIFDANTDEDAYEKALEFHPNILGVTATTCQAYEAYKFLDEAKKEKPKIVTVLGGVHASALPNEASKHCDCVVIGEGEIALNKIIIDFKSNFLPPKIVEGTEIKDLDALPFPAYDLLDLNKYAYSNPTRASYWFKQGPMYPQAMLMTSRGCAYRCPFCWNSKRKTTVRYLSAKKIIEEIKFHVENYGVKSLWFNDDDFLGNKKRLSEFIALFKAEGLDKKLTWACQARVNDISEEVVAQAKNAGCVLIFFGIESTSPNNLAYLKNNTVKLVDVEKAVEICHKAKVNICGSFIAGSPNETSEELQQNWNWILKHRRKGLTQVALGMLIPFPATTLYDDALKNNFVSQETIDYTRLSNSENPYIVNGNISSEEYKAFFKNKTVLIWAGTQIATNNLRGMLTPTFFKCCLKYPKTIATILSS